MLWYSTNSPLVLNSLPMNPLWERSITQSDKKRWLVGSFAIVDKAKAPQDAVFSWKDEDGDGANYCFRKPSNHRLTAKDSEQLGAPIQAIFSDSAVHFTIGGLTFKVTAWQPGVQLESHTIAYVNKHFPSVPTPKIIYEAADEEWNRSFLVFKMPKGRTLYQAWESLCSKRGRKIAEGILHNKQIPQQIASIVKTMASATSDKIETVDGCPVLEEQFRRMPVFPDPIWKLPRFGPFTSSQLQEYLKGPSITDENFFFTHMGLYVDNIILDDDWKVTALLQWQHAAFVPFFFIGAKPHIDPFLPTGLPNGAWSRLLRVAFDEEGFKLEEAKMDAWLNAIGKFDAGLVKLREM